MRFIRTALIQKRGRMFSGALWRTVWYSYPPAKSDRANSDKPLEYLAVSQQLSVELVPSLESFHTSIPARQKHLARLAQFSSLRSPHGRSMHLNLPGRVWIPAASPQRQPSCRIARPTFEWSCWAALTASPLHSPSLRLKCSLPHETAALSAPSLCLSPLPLCTDIDFPICFPIRSVRPKLDQFKTSAQPKWAIYNFSWKI